MSLRVASYVFGVRDPNALGAGDDGACLAIRFAGEAFFAARFAGTAWAGPAEEGDNRATTASAIASNVLASSPGVSERPRMAIRRRRASIWLPRAVICSSAVLSTSEGRIPDFGCRLTLRSSSSIRVRR